MNGRRLKYFRNADYNVTEEVLHHLAYQQVEPPPIESFVDLWDRDGTIELEVKWRGFQSFENDWLSFDLLRKDMRDIVSDYVAEISMNGTPSQRTLAKLLQKNNFANYGAVFIISRLDTMLNTIIIFFVSVIVPNNLDCDYMFSLV